ncbi:C40 family peptidase [Williamsia sterculiae]|uniref:Cell wall-associated hydrolase, NlpC family n=1 Tax=Williamsia sterculiae TaxID=1344003 RepID=A0A1N7DXA9_9NOCA|nr:C40 family peptidase [Williamsia sterculiae]SIR80492.1 Cell wall-associated hydrolase, NlpC family [Williamsia sterculiae]
MPPIELLIIPLRGLVAALGTGVLPQPGPTNHLRSTSTALDDARASSTRSTQALSAGWSGQGHEAASASLDSLHSVTAQLTTDGGEIADITERAAEVVRRGAVELEAICESFLHTANALGPALFTPAGIAAIVPVAVAHLQRGLAVVARVQTELHPQMDALRELGERQAPGEVSDVDARAQLERAGRELGNLRDAAFGPVDPQPPTGTDAASTQSAAAVPSAPPAGTETAGLSSAPTPGGVAVQLPDGSTAYAPNQRAATAVRAALSQRGVPYVWGGTTPGKGLDCSGLTQWAYRQSGVELPRLAQDQGSAGHAVSQSNLLPGDLAVWSGHVAMYVGNNQLVEAGDPVSVSPLRTSNAGQTFQGFYRVS